jgi:SWIM zinc finger
MTTATRRRVLPVRLDEATVIRKPICCCEILPAGLPGLVSINGKEYSWALNATLPEVGEPIVHGHRLTCLETGKVYDIDATLTSCDCPDFVFRRGTNDHKFCKHLLSVRKWRNAK